MNAERYKPLNIPPAPEQPAYKQPAASKDDWFNVGDYVQLAEDVEFLSLASGKTTVGKAGRKVYVAGFAIRPDNKAKCVTIMLADNHESGFATGNPQLMIEPIKSEREKFIEAALNIICESGAITKGGTLSYEIACNLYDAGFRAPE